MNIRFIASNLKKAEEELPRLTSRRVFIARGFGLSLLLGAAGACRAESRTTKEGHEFFDPADLPWHPAPGFSSGVWERIVSGGREEGVTTRFVRFDPGSGNSKVVTHDFWEEVYIVSGTFECGERAYKAGCVAVRPPGMPHGPFHSASGCLLFEVRYRVSR
jgi:ChrR-like protein with cupin domain